MRLPRTKMLPIDSAVDIMPASGRSMDAIAQGKLKQVGGRWTANGFKLNKNQVLLEVTKVFQATGVIHYPCTTSHLKKCSCGRSVHGTIKESCDFYLYSQFGPPPFLVVELKSKLRAFNETIEYPDCMYENEEDVGYSGPVLNFMHGIQTAIDPVEGDDALSNGNDDEQSADDPDEGNEGDNPFTLTAEARQLIDDGSDASDEEEYPEGDLTPEQMNMATCIEFEETLQKIIEDVDKLSKIQEINRQQCDSINNSTQRTVLGDLFHFMDRAKLPMHHEYKALFF